MQHSTQPWEPGTIARYLTVGGAVVDISHDTLHLADTEPNMTTAQCGGCNAYHNEEWGQTPRWASSIAEDEARKWAQSHAEKCRAMPRPAA